MASGRELSVSATRPHRKRPKQLQKFLEIGGQTREGELKIQELNGLLGKF
jgi:hypothetical protein